MTVGDNDGRDLGAIIQSLSTQSGIARHALSYAIGTNQQSDYGFASRIFDAYRHTLESGTHTDFMRFKSTDTFEPYILIYAIGSAVCTALSGPNGHNLANGVELSDEKNSLVEYMREGRIDYHRIWSMAAGYAKKGRFDFINEAMDEAKNVKPKPVRTVKPVKQGSAWD